MAEMSEQRREELGKLAKEAELLAEAEAGYDVERLKPRRRAPNVRVPDEEEEAPPRLTGQPGLVGMFDSGFSDLASRAKEIARGRSPFDGEGFLWLPAGARAGIQAAIAKVAQREYEDSLTPHGTVANVEHLGCRIAVEVMRILGLQGSVEGRHQDRQDPEQ